MVKAGRCRLCGANVSVRLTLRGMPRRVQTLLRPEAIPEDISVDLRIGQCVRCGLIQLVGSSILAEHYEEEYIWSIAFSPQAQTSMSALSDRWVREYELSGRQVLEVGGGDGYFAQLLQERGCRVTLIDPAPRACDVARRRGLTSVVQGYLSKNSFPGKRFEAMVMRHVLEHVPNPVDFLTLAREYVGSGGILLVEVPNVDSTIAGGRFQDFCAEHLSYFSPCTLAQAFHFSGFQVIETYTIEHGESLACIGRATDSYFFKMADEMAAFCQQLRNLILEAIGSGRRVGVFGAGTRGIALLALIDAGNLGVAYVVDSDPKKWKRLTPVTHLPVVSPEHLAADPVDDLLISTITYQDEIMRQLDWFPIGGRRFGLLEPEPHWVNPSVIST